jgi:serine phosphatase RsbU (regulator of sigma subunit)
MNLSCLREFLFSLLVFSSGLNFHAGNADSLAGVFHSRFLTENNNSLTSDTTFLNFSHRVSKAYSEKNDLYSAFRYNVIEDLFVQKIRLKYNDANYLARVTFDCVMNRVFLLEQKESFNEALEIAFALLRQFENGDDHKRISEILTEIGYIYYTFVKYDKALAFYQSAHEHVLKMNDPLAEGISYTNLYGVYSALNDPNTAIKYCISAAACFKKVNHRPGLKAAYGNLAIYYEDINIDQALSYALQSQRLKSDSVDMTNPGMDESILAGIYLKKARAQSSASKKKEFLAESNRLYNKVEKIGKLLRLKGLLKSAAHGYSEIEKENGNYKAAYEFIQLFHAYSDSLMGGSDIVSVRSMMKYEFDKKEQRRLMETQKREGEEQKAYERQKLYKNFFIIGFVAVIAFGLFGLRGYRTLQKAFRVISDQKAQGEVQKKVIEAKQAQLLNSINYAQRIQSSLLKSEEDLRTILPESFLLFFPRDIVSGDFYWFSKTEKGDVIIVLADCTGHGVPGALLSMIGITALNEIVNYRGITDPGKIIKNLSVALQDAFIKNKSVNKTDGMDISVCKIDPAKKKLLYTGVNQSLYCFDPKTGLQKTEAQLNSINGIFDVSDKEVLQHASFSLEQKLFFFMASDGLTGQIGESTNKKFMSSRLESFLQKNHEGDLNVVRDALASELKNWKGAAAQTDDITVLGFVP